MIPQPRSHARRPLLALLACALAACASDPSAPREPAWIPLFDGRSLDGWTVKITGLPVGQDPERVFRAADGVLRVSYPEGARFDGAFGHLFHDVTYGHYRLRLEVRFVGEQLPGGPGWAWRNSGIMIHGQRPESLRLDQEFPVSIEVQLLGGDGTNPRPTANLCTPGTNVEIDGELVTRHCTDSRSDTYPGDGWVRVEVEVRGGALVRHFVEGREVLRYARPQLDERDADARALALARGGELLLTEGTIALQSESHPCEFRNIELLPLEP